MEAVSDHLMAVHRKQINRLLINVPPGHMKSLQVGVFFPSWEWGPGGMPSLRYLTSSYKDDYVKRDSRKHRDLVNSGWYQHLWGSTTELARYGEASFENINRGTREGKPFSSLTAGRGDRVIIDDPHSVDGAESETERNKAVRRFRESVTTRLNNIAESAIIVVMQRLHSNDLSGAILAEEMGYEHLMLPEKFEPQRASYTRVRPSHLPPGTPPTMVRWDKREQRWVPIGKEKAYGLSEQVILEVEQREPVALFPQDRRKVEGELLFPERFPGWAIERDNKALGAYAVAGQKQQRPVAREGGLFKRQWFTFINAAPKDTEWVRYWDFAGTERKTSPKTAGVKMGLTPDNRIVIAHAITEQLEPPGVKKLVLATAALDNAGDERCEVWFSQDPAQAGKAQRIQYIQDLAGYVVRARREEGSKVSRAELLAVQIEGGNVDLLPGPWNEDFIAELSLFPGGTFADQVDAASGAYAVLLVKRAQRGHKIAGPLTTESPNRHPTGEDPHGRSIR